MLRKWKVRKPAICFQFQSGGWPVLAAAGVKFKLKVNESSGKIIPWLPEISKPQMLLKSKKAEDISERNSRTRKKSGRTSEKPVVKQKRGREFHRKDVSYWLVIMWTVWEKALMIPYHRMEHANLEHWRKRRINEITSTADDVVRNGNYRKKMEGVWGIALVLMRMKREDALDLFSEELNSLSFLIIRIRKSSTLCQKRRNVWWWEEAVLYFNKVPGMGNNMIIFDNADGYW